MDDEGVNVVQLEILQGLEDVGLDVLRAVVGVPELGLDEQLLPLDHSLLEQLLNNKVVFCPQIGRGETSRPLISWQLTWSASPITCSLS